MAKSCSRIERSLVAARRAVPVVVLFLAAIQLVISWPVSAARSALMSWHQSTEVSEADDVAAAGHHCAVVAGSPDAGASSTTDSSEDNSATDCDICGEMCHGMVHCAHCGLASLVDFQRLQVAAGFGEEALRVISFHNIVRSDDGHALRLDRPPILPA